MQALPTPRPAPQTATSFPRLDSPSSDPRSRTPASTLSENAPTSDVSMITSAVTASPVGDDSDVFFPTKEDEVASPVVLGGEFKPYTFEDLPIEIRSLTERFLESLSAKVHPTPLSIEALSDLFQEFYRKAEMHIATHVAALSSQLSRRDTSSSPLKKAGSKPEQQMLTAEEISDRKKARKLLEQKKVELEEAVERAVCEKVYAKIWHHRSSDDEEMDHKLRSRVAALSLVGIGLKELLISGTEEVPDEVRRKTTEQEEEIKAALSPARTSIQDMTQEKYPSGKLSHLITAHKNIVETLSNFFPSTSSADEILPTIIYSLLTSPPETINVISDLHFIQRFRTSSKIDGEAAYCLTNLEAAIQFLETVELPTLRSNESLQGPDKSINNTGSMAGTERKEAVPMQLGITPVETPSRNTEPFPEIQSSAAQSGTKPLTTSTRSSRSLSQLIQSQTNKLEAASDSFRGAVLDSADHAVGALNNTLENSFRFMFGRIRESQQTSTDGATEVPAPKTLEDARKLVSTPPPALDDDESSIGSPPRAIEINANENGSAGAKGPDGTSSRVLDLVGGRRLRDRSVDSSRSGGSGKRVSFAGPAADPLLEKTLSSPASASDSMLPPPLPSPSLASHGNAAVESMRNLGSSLNPLNQFAKISLFGRSVSASGIGAMQSAGTTPLPSIPQGTSTKPVTVEERTMAAVEDVRKMQIPSRKFVDCKSAKELRIGEIEELLAEFKRVSAALGKVMNA